MVVDDDETTCKIIAANLEKRGFSPEPYTNSVKAWEAMGKPDCPQIVLLDWVMPDLSGIDICRRLREQERESYVYVILLTSKNRKQDIVEGLDSGADDYMLKPIESMELLARLGVAKRTLSLEASLKRRNAALESVLRRHNLLGNICGNQAQGDSPADIKKRPSSDESADPNPYRFGPAVASLKPFAEIDQLFIRTLEALRIKPLELTTEQPPEQPEYIAWVALVLPRRKVWIDLCLECDKAGVQTLYKELLRQKASSEEGLQDVLGEVLNILTAPLKERVERYERMTLLTPFIPQVFRASEVQAVIGEDRPKAGFNVVGRNITLTFSFYESDSLVTVRDLSDLKLSEVLAEPLHVPGNPGAVLLNPGVLISNEHIRSLRKRVAAAGAELEVPVVKPSELAKSLRQGAF